MSDLKILQILGQHDSRQYVGWNRSERRLRRRRNGHRKRSDDGTSKRLCNVDSCDVPTFQQRDISAGSSDDDNSTDEVGRTDHPTTEGRRTKVEADSNFTKRFVKRWIVVRRSVGYWNDALRLSGNRSDKQGNPLLLFLVKQVKLEKINSF